MRKFLAAAGLAISALFLSAHWAFAIVFGGGPGSWPESLPEELEPYRAQAKSYTIATGTQEEVYQINFGNRDSFENIWPVIAGLKSSGAPLRLQRLSVDIAKDNRKLFSDDKPAVRIYAPPQRSSYGKPGADQRISPGPPWPDSIISPAGELPEYVQAAIVDDELTWVAAQPESHAGFHVRARVDIELVVDGDIIDLNRIALPTDSTIIDNRWPSSGETTDSPN
jgi:hypothetical protein